MAGGKTSVATLLTTAGVAVFVHEARRHRKALAFSANASALLRSAGIDAADASQMIGVIATPRGVFGKAELATFVSAITAHRHWDRNVGINP